MQVHIRLYKNATIYEQWACDIYDDKYQITTDFITAEFQTIEANGKCAEFIIKVKENDYTIALLIPFHQSDEWEIVTVSDEYVVGYYCLLDKE